MDNNIGEGNHSPLPTGKILQLFREAAKNVPILKYSWVFIAAICIISLCGFFKIDKWEVLLYPIGVILISYYGFAFSYLQKIQDPFNKMLLRFTCGVFIFCSAVMILSITSFIVLKSPDLSDWIAPRYPKNRVLPPVTLKGDSTKKKPEGGVTINLNDSSHATIIGRDQNNYYNDSAKHNKK